MVATTNKNARFCNNNQVSELDAANITVSSELANFPFENSQHDSRYKVFKFAGNFTIDNTNNLIYINDGSDFTASLTVADYTYSTLATEIATALNVVSSNWSCTYSTTTRKFTISNTGSVTLRETQTTNAAWGALGFTDGTDHTALSFEADESRNHTHESIIYDLGVPRPIDFFSCIGLIGENLTISASATVTLKGSTVSNFTSPGVTVTPSRTESGFFHFEDTVDMSYRFWEFKIIDQFNTVGPEGINISHIYLGDYETFTRNVGIGIGKTLNDKTVVKQSDSGAKFFREKTKFVNFSNLKMQRISRTDRNDFEVMFHDLGISKAFYLSIDPTLAISDAFDDLTKFVRFDSSPPFVHALNDTFDVTFNTTEVL